MQPTKKASEGARGRPPDPPEERALRRLVRAVVSKLRREGRLSDTEGGSLFRLTDEDLDALDTDLGFSESEQKEADAVVAKLVNRYSEAHRDRQIGYRSVGDARRRMFPSEAVRRKRRGPLTGRAAWESFVARLEADLFSRRRDE